MNDEPMIVLPLHATWLTADGVGKMLGWRDGRQVRERIACTPEFPKALRINGSGHPLSRADEVAEWANREREKCIGRPRARDTVPARYGKLLHQNYTKLWRLS